MPAAGRMDGEVGCWGRVWINEGRLVTDGATSVDGCFNFSLPLYFLPILFIGPKYRNSFAAKLKAVIAFFPPLPFFLLKSFIPIWPINFSTVKPCIVIYVKFPYNFHLESACFFCCCFFSMSVGRNLSRHKSLTLKLTSPMMLGHKLCPPFPPGPPPCPLSLFILSNLPSGTIIMSMLVCVCIL